MQSIYGDEGVDAITGTDGTQEVQVRAGTLERLFCRLAVFYSAFVNFYKS